MLFECPKESSPAFHLTGFGIRLNSTTTTQLILCRPYLIPAATPVALSKTTTISVANSISETHRLPTRGSPVFVSILAITLK